MKLNKLTLGISLALGTLVTNVMAEEANQEVETIVITGQKIDRTIKETPSSVAVVTAEDLEKQNAQNISDVFAGMANVSGDIMQGFNIRGINAFNVSGGGNSYLATMYVDGAPLPYRVIRSGATPVWDLAQVEVFRGPQSTLQGRNALAGAVHIRTQDPTYEWGGKAKATLGNLGQREFAFAGGGGLIDNMLAFRVSIEDKSLDGDVYNYTRREESNYEESRTVRGKLLFQPTDDFSALLTLTKTDSDLGGQWATYEEDGSVFDRQTWFNSEIWTKTETDIATLELNYDISDALSVVAVVTQNDSDYAYNWDGDMTAQQLTADNKYNRNDKTDSQEVRLTYQSDDLEAVVGVYASQLEVSDYAGGERHYPLVDSIGADFTGAVTGFLISQAGLDAATAAATAQMIAPLYPNIDPVVLAFNSTMAQEVKTKAVFADVKYRLSDSLDILAGLRFENEEQTNGSNAIYSITNYMPNPDDFGGLASQTGQLIAGINAFLNSFADNASTQAPASTEDFDAFIPKLGVSYHINEDVTTSFIYQKGYRSGGVGTNTARGEIYTYDEESTDNYELSYRSVWLDGNLMVNANAFFTEWEDQQVENQLSPNQFDLETQNVGLSEVKGFELEAFYYPTSQLSLVAGIGYAKTEFTDYKYEVPNATNPNESDIVDLSGREFADAPTWTSNVAVNYDFDSGLFVNVNANYQDSSYAYLDPCRSLTANRGFATRAECLVNGLDPKNESRTLVNAQFGYDFGDFLIRVDIRNLLDEDYVSYYFNDISEYDSYGQHQIGRSRQYSLTVQAEF